MKTVILLFFAFAISLAAQKNKINFEIDHVNVVVKDLSNAEFYLNNRLGFSTKPGKLHENSINNFFIKFKDKSYLEFLTASKIKDDLTKYYVSLIRENPAGAPAFLFLRINTEKEFQQFETNLLQSGIESIKEDLGYAQIISFDDEDLWNIVFIYYKSPVEDLPKYLTHENTAISLNSVWVNTSHSKLLIKKLRLLGFDIKETQTLPIGDFPGFKIELKNKAIFFSNFSGDNFIQGITIEIKNMKHTLSHLTNKTNYGYDLLISSRGALTLLNPKASFGMWIELLEK